MSREFTKPLTPALRREINISIDSQIQELYTCQMNAFVSAQLIGLQTFSNLINALPDGYPLPVKKV